MSSRFVKIKIRQIALPTFACLFLAGAHAGQASATVITPSPVSISAVEGSSFNGSVASFTDDNAIATLNSFTAWIHWGDGSPVTAGTIVQPGGVGTLFFFVQGSHAYPDEGSFVVTVTISDAPPGTGTAIVTSTATIGEGDSLSGAAVSFSAPVGVSFTAKVATFTDTLVPRY
jgi:hypothetical protein